jgi:hypothetical protein
MAAMRRLIAPVVALSLLLGFAGRAHACPGCKYSVAEAGVIGPDGGPGGPTPALPVGFNYSIYVMLGGLFSVLAMVAGIVVKGIRSADRRSSGPGGFPLS